MKKLLLLVVFLQISFFTFSNISRSIAPFLSDNYISGTTLKINGNKISAKKLGIINLPEMIKITGGDFTMGNELYINEKPSHKVTLSNYSISKFEITNIQYCDFLNSYKNETTTKELSDYPNETMCYEAEESGIQFLNGTWSVKEGYDNFPIIYVSWFGAYEYCKWLSNETGKKYSLPTEAQWEYAAGGGVLHQTYAGTISKSTVGNFAWISTNSESKIHEVGTKSANVFGIYDMNGNVWEWCLDWLNTSFYTSAAVTNPVNLTPDESRANRGGSWYYDSSFCRNSYRNGFSPSAADFDLGFRIVSVP